MAAWLYPKGGWFAAVGLLSSGNDRIRVFSQQEQIDKPNIPNQFGTTL
jgi:hypothetical protein